MRTSQWLTLVNSILALFDLKVSWLNVPIASELELLQRPVYHHSSGAWLWNIASSDFYSINSTKGTKAKQKRLTEWGRRCGAIKMGKSWKESTVGNPRRFGSESHRLGTRCQQGFFTVGSLLNLPFLLWFVYTFFFKTFIFALHFYKYYRMVFCYHINILY